MTTIAEVRARFRDDPIRRDVDLLLADITGKPTAWVFAHGDEAVDPRIEALIQRRLAGEPLQYIRGRTEFYSREFYVDDRALIPRPETEILVETVIQQSPRGARVIDIGSGSGCISVTLALERADLRVFAFDASIAALAVTRRNRDAHRATVRLAASDVLDAASARFDVIVSNPPYIPASDVETLATEVRDHEPHMALTPGREGTEVIERIYASARGARVFLEIGYGQAEAVRRIAQSHGYRVDGIVRDLAGIERVVISSPHG